MPPVTFQGSSAGVWVAPTMTFSVPSRAQIGDRLIAVIGANATTATTVFSSTDFRSITALTKAGSTRGQIAVCVREISGGEGTTVSVSSVGTVPGKLAGACFLYRGMRQGADMVASAANAFGSGFSSYAVPSINLSAYSDWLAMVTFIEAAVTITPSNVMIERYQGVGVGGAQLSIADQLPELVGATGTRTATTVAQQTGQAVLFAFPSNPPLGLDKGFALDVPGAIGLPVKGI